MILRCCYAIFWEPLGLLGRNGNRVGCLFHHLFQSVSQDDGVNRKILTATSTADTEYATINSPMALLNYRSDLSSLLN